MAFWRKQFPNMPIAEFDLIFNRYSHIAPMVESAPRLIQADAISVPVSLFQKNAFVRYVAVVTQPIDTDGHIDRATLESDYLVISGWGPWSGPLNSHELEIVMTPSAIGMPIRTSVLRPDLPSGTQGRVSALNGFSLQIPLTAPATMPALCVVAHDASTGKRSLLRNPANLPNCRLSQESK